METTYVYLVMLYDDKEPSGVFTTKEEALAAAERFLSAHWKNEEEMIKTSNMTEEEKEADMQYLQDEKECWEEEEFVDDLIYIQEVPLNKIVLYNGKEY